MTRTGRPPLPAAAKKSVQVPVRLTPAQAELVALALDLGATYGYPASASQVLAQVAVPWLRADLQALLEGRADEPPVPDDIRSRIVAALEAT